MNLFYKMLLADEGKKNSLYKCSLGYWTIGIGHLITKDPKIQTLAQAVLCLNKEIGRSTGGVITDQEIEHLLSFDVEYTLRTMGGYPRFRSVYNSLDKVRRKALLNMCFQLGCRGVSQFNRMLGHLEAGRYKDAANEALNSTWARQTPNRAKRIAEVIRTGTLDSYKDWGL